MILCKFGHIFKKMTRTKIYYISCFLILLCNFYSSLFGVLNDKFIQFRSGSDNLILGRLALSNQQGVFFESGLSGHYGAYMEKDQFKIYENETNVDFKEYETYCSQVAFQGVICSVLDAISPLDKNNNLSVFYFITVFLTALIFTLFLIWISNQFNLLTSFITFIFILSSYWIMLFSKSLWWCLWSFYLPFVILLLYLEKNKLSQISNRKIFQISVLLFFIKCLFSGYEYITTTILMYLVPLLYYSILHSWKIKDLFLKIIAASTGVIVGIFITFFILIFQLGNLNSRKVNGIDYILETLARRSYDAPEKYEGIMKESMNIPVIDVIKMYLNGNAYELKSSYISFQITFLHIILLLIIPCVLLIYYYFKTKNPKIIALTTCFWVSILAPLSWIVLFKSHSYIHTHINLIIWYMPFLLFGFIITGYSFSKLIDYKPNTNINF